MDAYYNFDYCFEFVDTDEVDELSEGDWFRSGSNPEKGFYEYLAPVVPNGWKKIGSGQIKGTACGNGLLYFMEDCCQEGWKLYTSKPDPPKFGEYGLQDPRDLKIISNVGASFRTVGWVPSEITEKYSDIEVVARSLKIAEDPKGSSVNLDFYLVPQDLIPHRSGNSISILEKFSLLIGVLVIVVFVYIFFI